jgi:type IV pilus assembly protein PilC
MPSEEWVMAHARVAGRPHRRAKASDLAAFFQQLSTLANAGTPLLQAIRLAAQQNQSLKMREVLEEIAGRVASGSTLHAAAALHPRVFAHSWVEVIRVGEITGKLGQVLLELDRQIQEARATRRRTEGALVYPVILLCVATAALTIMLWFVVPTFSEMFRDMGAKLPAITQFVVDGSDYLVAYGVYAAAGLAAAGGGAWRYLRTESGRRTAEGLALAVPLVGDLMVQMAMYRFSSNIALLLKSGVPMLETMAALRGIFHTSPVYRDALERVRGRVAAGRPLAAALEEVGLFTPMVTNLVRTGEESGQLALTMERAAPYYKEQTEAMILKVTKLMEPTIIVGMGVTIAGLMLAIYTPMFEMAGNVK